MPAFETLDWRRPDVDGIVNGRGLLTVSNNTLHGTIQWFTECGYTIWPLHFDSGIGYAVQEIGVLCNWRERFGYELSATSRNLDALRDGLTSWPSAPNGSVVVLHHFERAWSEDAGWSRGLLAILSEQSLCELAVGRRFLALVEAESLVGQACDELSIRYPSSAPPRSAA